MQETHKKHTLHKTKKHIKENTRKEEMQNYIHKEWCIETNIDLG